MAEADQAEQYAKEWLGRIGRTLRVDLGEADAPPAHGEPRPGSGEVGAAAGPLPAWLAEGSARGDNGLWEQLLSQLASTPQVQSAFCLLQQSAVKSTHACAC